MPSTATSSQPPLSLGLLCIYKQYKADTETIAGWLKANAVKHGYKFDGQDGTAIRTSDFVPSECLHDPFLGSSLSICPPPFFPLHSDYANLRMFTLPRRTMFRISSTKDFFHSVWQGGSPPNGK